MSDFTNTTPALSYKSILKIDGLNQEIDSTARHITDGVGNNVGLKLRTTGASFLGYLDVHGELDVQGDLIINSDAYFHSAVQFEDSITMNGGDLTISAGSLIIPGTIEIEEGGDVLIEGTVEAGGLQIGNVTEPLVITVGYDFEASEGGIIAFKELGYPPTPEAGQSFLYTKASDGKMHYTTSGITPVEAEIVTILAGETTIQTLVVTGDIEIESDGEISGRLTLNNQNALIFSHADGFVIEDRQGFAVFSEDKDGAMSGNHAIRIGVDDNEPTDIEFMTGSSHSAETMVISDEGNVGIYGASPLSPYKPAALLDIMGVGETEIAFQIKDDNDFKMVQISGSPGSGNTFMKFGDIDGEGELLTFTIDEGSKQVTIDEGDLDVSGCIHVGSTLNDHIDGQIIADTLLISGDITGTYIEAATIFADGAGIDASSFEDCTFYGNVEFESGVQFGSSIQLDVEAQWDFGGADEIRIGEGEMNMTSSCQIAVGTTEIRGNGDIEAGGTVSGTELQTSGVMQMAESTTPSALAHHGKIYTKTDNEMYFQDGAGSEHQVTNQSGGTGLADEGTNYIYVVADGIATANGTDLLAVYATAKAAVYSPVLSATNRYVIMCSPGQYDLGSGTLVLDTDFIDVKSTTGERDVILITTAASSNDAQAGAAISIETDDCVVVGVTALGKRFQIYNGGGADYRLINCQGDDKSFGFKSVAAGYHEKCECMGDFAFGCVTGGDASGVFVDCIGNGNFNFGGSAGVASGTFIRCVCKTSYGFASYWQETASGYFFMCENRGSGGGAFGDFGSGDDSIASGDFWYCKSEYGGSFGAGLRSEFSGNAWYCTAGAFSFGSRYGNVTEGGGEFTGAAYYCYAEEESFGGNEVAYSEFTGNAYYCIAGADSFSNDAALAFSGSIKLCLSNDAELNA